MITIFLNNQEILTKENTLLSFLKERSDIKPCCAIAVNSNFIPRAEYATTFLRQHDVIDIVSPMQGG